MNITINMDEDISEISDGENKLTLPTAEIIEKKVYDIIIKLQNVVKKGKEIAYNLSQENSV